MNDLRERARQAALDTLLEFHPDARSTGDLTALTDDADRIAAAVQKALAGDDEPQPPAPDAYRGFEIRVSPDQRNIAVYDPTNGPWFVPDESCKGRFVPTAELDAAGWTQYVPALDGSGTAELEGKLAPNRATGGTDGG